MLTELINHVSSGTFVFLMIACFLAAFIDAISGGGGLISLPAYMASGIPPHMALGTNKMSAFLATVASSVKFAKSGKINWDIMKKLPIFSFIGACLGVKTILLLDSKYLYPITIILLVGVLAYTLVNKKIGETNEFAGLDSKNLMYGRIFAFILGFYDGFFGPGTGSFLIFMLIRVFKLDFTNASGNTKILNLTSNVASVIMFVYYGQINYYYSLPLGIVMVFGAIVGAKFAIVKGSKFIKPIFLTVTSVVLLKMIVEVALKIMGGNF